MEHILICDTIENKSLYPHWIFENSYKKYIYGSFSNRIFELDNVTYEFITTGKKSDPLYDYAAIMAALEDSFIVKTENNNKLLQQYFAETDINNKALFTGATLMISQACNLSCIYCYGKDGEYTNKGFMDFDTAKTTVDWLFKYMPENEAILITFFGGEPLLSFSLIKQIVEYANNKACEQNRQVKYTMTTNGTLIDNKIEQFIIENNISTQISMDGLKETHDANRYYSSLKGCYDDVLKHTASLRTKNRLSVRATISPKSLNIMENINHILSLGFSKVAWANASNLLSDEDYDKLTESIHLLIEYVECLINEGNFEQLRRYTMLTTVIQRLNKPKPRLRSCGAGRHVMAVDISGDIFPCHRFVGMDEFKLGNIQDVDIEEMNKLPFYKQLGIHHFPKCMDCEVQGLCGGACINENYYETGKITIPRTSQCNYIKQMCKDLIKLYTSLTSAQKKEIFGE